MTGVPLATPDTLAQLAVRYGGELDPALRELRVERAVSPADATGETDLALVVARAHLAAARAAPAVLLVAPELAPELPIGRRWVHPHALWVFARLLAPVEEPGSGIHPAAIVAPAAELGAGTSVGPGAVVMAGARLGAGCVVEPGAVVYGCATVGDRVVIGANAVVGGPGFGWASGPDGELLRIPQRGGVVIEDDVELGALVTVDSGTLGPTRIRRGAKLDAHVHVGHNADIGGGCLIAAQVGLAGSVRLGAGVQVGGQSGFADHVAVGDGARVAAKSGVIGDVRPRATVAGFPAVARVRWLRGMARLMHLAKGDRRR